MRPTKRLREILLAIRTARFPQPPKRRYDLLGDQLAGKAGGRGRVREGGVGGRGPTRQPRAGERLVAVEPRPVFLEPCPDRDAEADRLVKMLRHRLGSAAVQQTQRMRKPTWWTIELDLPREQVLEVARETLGEIDPGWEQTLNLT